jgi:hypothetical protein
MFALLLVQPANGMMLATAVTAATQAVPTDAALDMAKWAKKAGGNQDHHHGPKHN